MSKRREILLGGLGGQGVILAGVLIGKAAAADGLQVAGSNSYGAQARGSSCQASVVVSADIIDYPHAETPDLFVAMSQGAYEAYGPQVAQDGLILYDSDLVKPQGIRQEMGLAITALALDELGNKQVANVAWVGAVNGFAELISPAALEAAVRDTVPERFLELNLKALKRGAALGRSLREAR